MTSRAGPGPAKIVMTLGQLWLDPVFVFY
jgi:hypothetical protein